MKTKSFKQVGISFFVLVVILFLNVSIVSAQGADKGYYTATISRQSLKEPSFKVTITALDSVSLKFKAAIVNSSGNKLTLSISSVMGNLYSNTVSDSSYAQS